MIAEGNLRFDDLAAAQAGGANAHLARSAVHARPYRPQVHVPAPLGDVVRVADVVARPRLLAADFTNLCHDYSQSVPQGCPTSRDF